MQNLVMGGNAALPADELDVFIEWPVSAGTLDSSTYLLDESGKVRSDADMIFYNQRSDAAGSVELSESEAGRTRIKIDLARVPTDVSRIVMCVTIEERHQTMAAFEGASATILIAGDAVIGFKPELTGAREIALRVIQIYRRNGAWRCRADGQGFNDGLAPLARSFGIDVADDEEAPPRSAPPKFPESPPSSPAPEPIRELAGAPLAPPPPALSQPEPATRLTPGRPLLNWTALDSSNFGEISTTLAWTSQCGGIQGRPRPLNLTLGCLFELKDGRKGVVQSWDTNGQFDAAPYVQLGAADLSGVSGEQKLRINGDCWQSIRRLTLFTFVRSGAPSWRTAAISLAISAAGKDPVSLLQEEGTEGCGLLGLLTIENKADTMEFSRLARFIVGHRELDEALGYGLRWHTRYE